MYNFKIAFIYRLDLMVIKVRDNGTGCNETQLLGNLRT